MSPILFFLLPTTHELVIIAFLLSVSSCIYNFAKNNGPGFVDSDNRVNFQTVLF